ncbi:hypothetical protein SEA_KEANU_72 [Streptomyces phage Keanu]|nr:hypothetical protein SEA_KEANU_72 [Streptomyces phage Keanu]
MNDQRMHYVKTIRDAAVPLDSLIHKLTEENAHALNRTRFSLSEQWIAVYPHPEDRDLVIGLAAEEFSKAGWSIHAESASRSEDPKQPVISMSFGHPRTKTKTGDGEGPKRKWAMRFEVPMPDPSIPITPDLIEYYAKQAADITRGLMAQQVVEEEGKMPGTWNQGGANFRPPTREGVPPITPVIPLSTTATAPMPLFGADPDDEEQT